MRRIFLRTFVFFFIFFLFFILYESRAFAGYTITTTPESPEQPRNTEAHDYIYGDGSVSGTNPTSVVTENTKTVHIKFTGLVPDKDYIVCLITACFQGGVDLLEIEGTDFVERKSKSDGSLTLDVCAAGEDSLRLLDKDEHECNDGRTGEDGDYFWGGHVYAAALGASGEPNLAGAAAFYVSRYYPQITVTPQKPTPNDEIKVTITGTRRPHGRKNRNNYAVEIARMDNPGQLYSQECIFVPKDLSKTVELEKREEGDFIIKINEQGNEGGLHRDDCAAEFTYYWIKIHVRSDPGKNKGIEIIPDPNGQDMAGLRSSKPAPPPPCASAFESNNCPKVKTGISLDIKTSPSGFVKDIFGLILSVSGGIALLLIIYSGYQLMAARGNPEMLQTAKDQLVAAIVGLVFIIFSLVILQVIGVDILKIPGFGE